ncbi:MAG: hypothetical protein ACTSRZ_18000 [Promethearchaeota archaeon]
MDIKSYKEEENLEFNESDFMWGEVNFRNITTGYFNDLPLIQIDLESCWEVTCPCAKNTTTPCMVKCFECGDV